MTITTELTRMAVVCTRFGACLSSLVSSTVRVDEETGVGFVPYVDHGGCTICVLSLRENPLGHDARPGTKKSTANALVQSKQTGHRASPPRRTRHKPPLQDPSPQQTLSDQSKIQMIQIITCCTFSITPVSPSWESHTPHLTLARPIRGSRRTRACLSEVSCKFPPNIHTVPRSSCTPAKYATCPAISDGGGRAAEYPGRQAR